MQNKKKILLCVNSDIGRSNTIGFRFGKIAAELIAAGHKVDIVARANYNTHLRANVPWYGNVLSRFLNALRIYVFPSLNVRTLDMRVFDSFVLRTLRRKNACYDVALIGEFTPHTIQFLQNKSTNVFFDMPIGHYAYVDWLGKQGIQVGVDSKNNPSEINTVLKMVHHIVVPSQFVSETLHQANIQTTATIVPFGANLPPRWDEEHILTRSSKEPFTFLFVGNVNYRKGVVYLLEAWKKLSLPNAKLIICGRVYKELSKEIIKWQSADVVFTGFVSVTEYFKQAHVFVFPSLLEGSAKVIYEAMSYGLPIITTPNAGSIVVDGETGSLVPIANVECLVERMRFYYDHRDITLKLGVNAKHKVANYSWDRYAKRVVEILLSI